MQAQLRSLQELFVETAAAHSAAVPALRGADPNWTAWFANYLSGRLCPPLKIPPTPAQLARSLTMYDIEHRRLRDAAPWSEYCALRLASEYGLRPD